jgi:hypothetical protein
MGNIGFYLPVDVVGVELVEDVIFISCRIVHRRTWIVEPAGRSIDVAVRSPTSEERVVAHSANLVGVNGCALASVSILSQRARQYCKEGGAQAKRLHHLDAVRERWMERYTPRAVEEVAAILYASVNPGRPAVTIQAISNWQCSAEQGMVEMRARYPFLLTNTKKDEITERSPPITKATLRAEKSGQRGFSTGERRDAVKCGS